MNPISLSTNSVNSLGGVGSVYSPKAPSGLGGANGVSNSGGNFADAIGDALNNVSKAQSEATTMSREFQMENPNVSLEETMITLQKASLGFQAAVQVRNKLVTAYNDVMNMSV
jgi:flagellar hook-basal body complex protein FliE